jgi:hypothetical protein
MTGREAELEDVVFRRRNPPGAVEHISVLAITNFCRLLLL